MKPVVLLSLLTLVLTTSLPAAEWDFKASNPPEMQPLTNHSSPAYQTAKLFMHGVNLGDYLEAGRYGVTVKVEEFAQIKAEGFDHVRIPVGWHRYTGDAPDFTLQPEIFAKADFAVTNALNNKLAVMINIHHFGDFDTNPVAATDKFIAIWRQVAAHYRDFPNTLIFELDNEPHQNATTAAVNPIYPKVIAEIRKTNPHRTLVVEPGNWGGIGELKNLILPPDDNIIVSVHSYDPFAFTHQGTSWTGNDAKVTGFEFPGPPEKPLVPDPAANAAPHMLDIVQKYNTLPTDKNPIGPLAFKPKLQYVRAWSDYYGRPVHIGEFGCYYKVDLASRTRYYAEFRKAAAELNLGWAMWDWSANFRYWDTRNNQAVPGMHEALFGK
ncbi:MAG TPA: glycoside hydrolase family 5 protein [Candidatus Paceibacterota bacterium]|nr:glycoside hydrolase family 5 protein [Candidatus Paceibacterota bacterium]